MSDYRLTQQLSRARRAGLPATLTQIEWARTIKYFNGKCAYCLRDKYNVVEHFVPMIKGGGTTKDNCIPACWSCNSRKDSFCPQVREAFPREALERVKAFLEQYRESAA